MVWRDQQCKPGSRVRYELRLVIVQQLLQLLEAESARFGEFGDDADPANAVHHRHGAGKHQVSTGARLQAVTIREGSLALLTQLAFRFALGQTAALEEVICRRVDAVA